MARRRNQPAPDIEWNFRSFPVAFAFACGALVATLVIIFLNSVYLPWLVSLFAVSFGSAHIIGHALRRRRLDKQVERDEEEERDRRAYAARQAAALEAEAESHSARRRRRRR